jgi:hypothetical protein
LAFLIASAIVPTNLNASSGKLSCKPSKISLNPLIVSFTGTYTPGLPVNCSAEYVFCDKNNLILRALATTNLSS